MKSARALHLNRRAGLEFHIKLYELNCLLHQSSRHIRSMQDRLKRLIGQDHNKMSLKIELKPLGYNDEGEDELLQSGVPDLCIVESLADIID